MSDQFDTRIDIVTPENISFEYRLAGPFQRLPAYLVDVSLRIAAVAGVFILLLCSGAANVFGFGPLLITMFVLEWFYGGLFEALSNGQTPGKRMMRLRVVAVDGSPITGSQAVLRNLLRFADMLPIMFNYLPTFQLGLLTMMFGNRYQRLGDLVAGTMVVVEEPQRLFGVARVTEPEALRLAAEIPPGFQVGRSLALALSNYVQRRGSFPWPRRLEIARHLGQPLVEILGLPPDTNHDLLLCALYHRAFIDDRDEAYDDRAETNKEAEDPFARIAG